MGFLRFLSSLRTLAKNGDITIRDAYKFAQQEFGEVSDLLKLQINKIFKDADAPSIRKPEGKVIEASFKPGRDKTGKVVEESESQRLGLAGLKNPYRIGGGLDPVEGMTRTAARVVLDRKGIKVPEKGDPIDVFEENFGGDALMDLKEAGEELLEKETTGRITESMGEFLESKGLFDLKVDKTLPKGMTNEELLKKLMDEDPEEFAKGGRVGYEDGGPTKDEYGIMSLPSVPSNPNSVNDDIDRVAQLVAQSYKMGPEEQMNNKQIAYDRIEEIAEQISYGGNIDGVRSNLIDYFNDKVQEYENMIQEFSTGGRVGFQIGGPAYDATDPIYGSSAITVTPDTIMGPQGNQIQAQTGVNPLLQRIQNAQNAPSASETLGNLYNKQGIMNAQNNFLRKAVQSDPQAYETTGSGFTSDLRHKTAAAQLRDNLGGGIIGQVAANALGGIREIPQLLTGDFKGVAEDIKANYLGAKNIPVGLTPQESYDYLIAQQQVDPGAATAQPSAMPQGSPGQLNPTPTQNAGPSREVIMQRILEDIENTSFQKNQVADMYPDQFKTGLDLDYLKTLNPDEVKLALDNAYLQGENFQNPDFSTGRIGGGRPFFRYGPEYMKKTNRSNPLSLSRAPTGYNLRNQLGELESILGKEGIKPYMTKVDDALIDLYRGDYSGDTDLQKRIFGLASGGRVGYAYGSGLKLIQLLQKAGKSLKDEIKKAVDDLIPSGDPKLDADMAVDNMLEDLNIDRDTLDQYDVLDAYGLAYDELKRPILKEIEKTKSLAPKMVERFELMEKYPGIDEELVAKIVDDPDPQRKAEVLATIEQAFELMKKGKSSDEVLDIMKQMTDRTKQAGGGLSYLSGF